jgi:hypothetical protein
MSLWLRFGPLLLALATALPAQAAERPVSFSRDIKPILASKCYACHGPDEQNRKADLRLDTADGAHESGVIEPGKPDASELIARVTSQDPDEQMPPSDSKKPPLTAEELALLKRWIAAGAKYDAHWSYVPPVRTAPPVIETEKWRDWARNPIDAFILAQQLEHQLHPAADAERRTLIRRLTFDLTGLPPSETEVAAFLADESPDAYERLVDRLLRSPHLGERLAVMWLDAVRFADTGGYHSDNHRDVSPYRDWVIRAFNENMPFDQFTLEQLAGDLFPLATNDQKIASGYNRLLMTTEEGGAQAKEYTAKYLGDRVRNVSSVWLGATLGCAECHDHKFDPYTAKDFYSMGAFFADVQEKAVGRQDQTSVPTNEQLARLSAIDQRIAALNKALDEPSAELDAAQAKWEEATLAKLTSSSNAWMVVKPSEVTSANQQTLTVQDDQSVLASGENPAKDTYTITLPAALDKITGLRLEALRHESLANQGLSRANGNFVLTEVSVALVNSSGAQSQPVKLKSAVADFSQDTYPIAHAIDGKNNTGWAVAGHQQPADHVAAFTFEKPVSGGGEARLVVKLAHDSQFPQHNIGRFRLALTGQDQPSLTTPDGLPVELANILQTPAAQRSAAAAHKLQQHFRRVASETAATREEVAQLEQEKKTITDQASTLITMSGSPRTVRILPRGNWLDDTGEIVAPAIPAFLGKLETGERRASRLDLAQWLVARENPLTARVFVNRLWKIMYGHGLARSLEDYGTQGSYPSHPELLDWLAVEFMESDWNVRHLLKLMAMSHTYQQASTTSLAVRAKDPANDWLARQDAYRLDGEFVRDNALAISGLLVRNVGGPSVKPYQPAGYWQFLNFPRRTYANDHGENLYRRGLYTYWQRSFLNPSLVAFDVPSREECTNERPRSNTPLQALVLLNDPTFVEAARVFAGRMIQQGGTDAPQRLDYAFQRAVGRPATPGEIQVLTALVAKHRAAYTADPASAQQLVAEGESQPPENVDVSELAAWTSVARVILNLHETVTRN